MGKIEKNRVMCALWTEVELEMWQVSDGTEVYMLLLPSRLSQMVCNSLELM